MKRSEGVRIDPSREVYERDPENKKNWPTYEAYFEWADKVNESIIDIETMLMKPDTKTIKVTTRIKGKPDMVHWFTKAEYEKWKASGGDVLRLEDDPWWQSLTPLQQSHYLEKWRREGVLKDHE